MAVATGTAALIGAGVSALGLFGGAKAQAGASNRAVEAQERAAQQALQLEREREAARKAEYDQAQARYREEYAAWDQQRRAILQHYGVDIPGSAGGGGGTPSTFTSKVRAAQEARAGGGAPDTGAVDAAAYGGIPQRAALTLGRLVAPAANAGPMTAEQGAPEDWTDWRKYGARLG